MVYKYRITIVESERGWGQSLWHEYLGSEVEAYTRIEEINSRNTAATAPDYYIQADPGPVKVWVKE